MTAKKRKFHKTLLSILDESMENIFGETALQAVYYHLEKGYFLKVKDIPENPRTFSKAIEEMFGEIGAEVIETLLVRDLLKKFRAKSQGNETEKLVCWLGNYKAQARGQTKP